MFKNLLKFTKLASVVYVIELSKVHGKTIYVTLKICLFWENGKMEKLTSR